MKVIRLIKDHVCRTILAMRGFQLTGADWLLPWFLYAASPAVSRIARTHIADFPDFSARLGSNDLYTFANLFEDYPIRKLREALSQVNQVVDAGANVGAFSWLVLRMAAQIGQRVTVTAIEPSQENVRHLKAQPFAGRLDILHGAVGPEDGWGQMIQGKNSVTHRVKFAKERSRDSVEIFSLEALCNKSTLLKMDIEGGEFSILQRGLPTNVRYLFLEWHHGPETGRPADPRPLIEEGTWEKLSNDLYGSSTWFWRL